MINLRKGTVELNKIEQRIIAFKVWWYVEGHGLFTELDKALDTGLPVSAQSVVITENGYEVLSQQERHLHDQTGSRLDDPSDMSSSRPVSE
jgi:hypothetical protein